MPTGSRSTHALRMRVAERGFTLVELLVVIAIIGVLVSLLLPAVQAAREAARRTQCRNHLKQISLAILLHHDAQTHFPTGGWGWWWHGDPDRGFDRQQPGGWIFTVLPFLEEQSLFELGAGATQSEKELANGRRIRIALPVFYCPSRRSPSLYPNTVIGAPFYNAEKTLVQARTDYCAVLSSTDVTASVQAAIQGQPRTLAQGEAVDFPWRDFSDHTGIVFVRSEVTLAQVEDGTSHTYLVGEKYLNPDHYLTGIDPGDNHDMYIAHNNDMGRWTTYDPETPGAHLEPRQDRPGFTDGSRFGSPHAAGCHMAFCDGSVRTVSYSISPRLHHLQGDRRDGEVTYAETR